MAKHGRKQADDIALRGMLALKQGQPLPQIEHPKKLPEGTAQSLAGRYRFKDMEIELSANAGRLYLIPCKGGVRTEIRQLDKDYIVDDVTGFGPKIKADGKTFKLGPDTFQRVQEPSSQPVPEKWQGLIGEYGQDHNILYILEKDGKLHALIEWVFLYPLSNT